VGEGGGVAGNPDLGYIITDEQNEAERLAQAFEKGQETGRKEKGAGKGG
jgi:hypothetical protein